MKRIILILSSIILSNTVNCAVLKEKQNNSKFVYVEGYPDEWNDPEYDDLVHFFYTLKDLKKEKDKSKFLCQWLNAAQTYFQDEKSPIFFSRCLYDLVKLKDQETISYWFKLYLENNPNWLIEWYEYSKKNMSLFEPQNLSSSILALAKLDLKIDQDWLNSWYKYSKSKFPLFNSQALSSSIFALSKLNIKIDKEWLNSWYKYSKSKMHLYNPQELSNSIYALASLNEEIDKQWLDIWYRYSKEKLVLFNYQDFNNSLYGIVKLNLKVDNQWLADWYKYSKEKMALFETIDFSDSINTLSKLNISIDKQWLSSWYKYSKSKMNLFNAKELTSMIHALAVLDVNLDKSWLEIWCKYSKEKMLTYSPQDLSNSMYAMGHFNISVDTQWLYHWFQYSKWGMSKFNAQDLSNAIYGLAKLNIDNLDIYIDKQWLNVWYQYSIEKMPTFNSQDFSDSIYALAQLKINIDGQWLNDWYKHSIERMETFSSKELSSSIYSLSLLNRAIDQQWLDSWYKYSEDKLALFNSQSLSNSLYAFALLDIIPDNSFLLKTKNLPILKDLKKLEIETLHQLFLFNQFYHMKTNLMWLKIDSASWQKNLYQNPNGTEKQVLRALKRIFRESDIFIEKWINAIASHVDFYIESLNLVIQVDGPYHFLKNGQLNSSSVLITKLLEFYGYQVLRLSYKDIDDVNNNNLVKFIKELLPKFETEKFNAQELSNKLYESALLDVLPEELFLLEAKNTLVLNGVDLLGREILHQLFLFDQYYYMKTNTHWLEIDKKKLYDLERPEPTVAQNLTKYILEDNYNVQNICGQEFFEEIADYVDLYIHSERLVIFVDTPENYLSNGELNSSSKLISKILEFYGYKVLRFKSFK